MQIRKTRIDDLDTLAIIFTRARAFMQKNGNATQWAGTYPSAELIKQDILLGQSYVCEEQQRILATFVLMEGDEPTYAVIAGAWKNALPYATLHRVAVSGEQRGLADLIIAWAFKRIANLRSDTHANNIPMQHAFERNGFERCGTVWMADGTARIAYQRTK